MAGLKKKKKEPSTSPNVILVIFLVLFVLLSIGFGFWGYSGMAASAEAQNKATLAATAVKVEKNTNKYYSMLYRDLRLALGDKIDEKEEAEWKIDRDEFMKEGYGAFKDESNKEAAKKFMDELEKKYGGLDAAGKYKSNVLVELQLAQAKIKELDGKAYASIIDHEKTKNLLKDLLKKQDEFHQDALARIQKNNTLAMAASKSGRDEYAKAVELNRELNKQLKDKDDETERLKEDYEKRLKIKDFALRDLKREMADAGAAVAGGAIGGRPGGDAFPLLLDVNMGKPLWDAPVGKVVRVDLDVRQVSINLGSAHGIKPETTFNIFGANSAGRAEKQLKGSIEVIKVLDASTSLARITSLYDAEGHEILLNFESRNKFQRENEVPIKDGDLLFNLFWGTRVAVIGYVNITGEPSDNPAEQIRQMDDFMYLLRRNGMQVDAHVDLRNGQIQGKLSSKTRYLIKGDDLQVAIEKPAAPVEGDDKEKEPAKEAGGPGDRNEAINKSSTALRKEAIEKGLLLISAENFSHMMGYRRARNANAVEISGFRPMLPIAGAVEAGARPPEPPAAVEEKKEM